jgi:hypothetical protein
MSKLSPRERRLLAGCFLVLGTMASVILLKEFLDQRTALQARLQALTTEQTNNGIWLQDRAFQEKRSAWISKTLPTSESLLSSGGTLLQDIQDSALDLQLTFVRNPTLNDPEKTAQYDEVSVQANFRGELSTLLSWLATLQSPERFLVIKRLEMELDSRAKEPTPHAFCNVTLARWFKPGA